MEPPRAAAYRAAGHWTDQRVDDGLRAGAAAHPDRTAIVDRDRRLSYAELDAWTGRMAGLLAGLGVGPGEVVSFQLPNWAEAVVSHQAIARLGAISNPIIPIYRRREVGFILAQARSRVFVVPDAFRGFDHAGLADDLRSELDTLEHVIVVGRDRSPLADGAAPPPAAPRRPADEPVLLLYTSGTESEPKGVVHTHETLCYENRSIVEMYGLRRGEVSFIASPVTHITGVLYGLQMPFELQGTVVLLDTWDAGAALELIERERCTFSVGATPFLHGIVNHPRRPEHDISSLRTFLCGGADVPPALIRAATGLGMLATRVYGSTECPVVTGTPPGAPLRDHAETDGGAIAPTEIRLVDDAGAVLSAPAAGHVQARGPDVCSGYRDPALTARAFTADGWFATGDLGHLHETGALTISGRSKDIILRGGENLSAKEVEDLLFEHPDVAQVAIVGFPDEVMGERACAYVVGPDTITLDTLTAFLRERGVASQKLPERLRVVSALPVTASGKVQKFVLRDAERGGRAWAP